MAISRQEREFVAYVVELMQSVGPVESRRMFGGHGIFLEGLMFALVMDRVLYLKADTKSRNDFVSLGMQAFTYQKSGKECALSYFQSPEETLEDVDEMNVWANKAYGAALRKAARTRKK